MLVYHIDCHNVLEPNQEISLTKFEDCPPIPNAAKLSTLDLQYGLSQWGKRMLFGHDIRQYDQTKDTQTIELVFELIRQKYFPEKFSRFQSIFAVTNINDLKRWLLYFKDTSFKVVTLEVCPSHVQTFDAIYLKDGGYHVKDPHTNNKVTRHSNLLMLERAFDYWSGKYSLHPQIESLIKLPVTVKEILPISGYTRPL